MLQCINPDLAEEARLWGLQSITCHTALADPRNPWTGQWPNGVDPETVTAQALVSLLAEDSDTEDGEVVLLLDSMACFEIPGFEGKRTIVQAMFDPLNKRLLSLSLIRNDSAWVHAQWTPSARAATVA